jgi:hypothetical protein
MEHLKLLSSASSSASKSDLFLSDSGDRGKRTVDARWRWSVRTGRLDDGTVVRQRQVK